MVKKKFNDYGEVKIKKELIEMWLNVLLLVKIGIILKLGIFEYWIGK